MVSLYEIFSNLLSPEQNVLIEQTAVKALCTKVTEIAQEILEKVREVADIDIATAHIVDQIYFDSTFSQSYRETLGGDGEAMGVIAELFEQACIDYVKKRLQ